MRVLITGGYGFIGSFVGEMFALEGHEVHIIDNLSTGNKENAKFSHVFYHISVEDPDCEKIFKKFKFDVVIHLAAQVNVTVSMDDPYIDSKYNVLGLSNMLSLAKKYGAGKVVFASSAAVYGLNEEIPLNEGSLCDPVSPYGMNKWIGEMYCQKWTELFGLDTLCFRFSNVYGPRQGTIGEGGVVSIFIQRAAQEKELIVYGDGEQTRDFIFVQDVAEAIYRGVEKDLSGVYNLSTNTGVSVNQLIEALRNLTGVKKVNYQEERKGDIKHSRLDNARIKSDLDWDPFHSYEEGLAKTYQWFKENEQSPPKIEKKKEGKTSGWKSRLNPVRPYLENIGIFLVVYMLGALVDIHYFMVDYQLIYIVLVSFLLRKSQSVISIGMASIWFLADNAAIGRDLISSLINPGLLIHISIYIFAGLSIRYALDKKDILLRRYRDEAAAARENYQSLNTAYADIVKVKEELQNQILYTENSIGMLYKIMRDMDSLDPQKIYKASINTIETLLKSNEVVFYLLETSGEKLMMMDKSECLDADPIIRGEQEEFYMEVLRTNQLYVNKSLDKNLPSMIVPLYIKNQPAGVICVDGLAFEQLSLFYMNLMDVISEMISSSLSLAKEHESMLGEQRARKILNSNRKVVNV
ncbi:NAD-dependent epimerase/dehydratase family protein [Bacillus infantis]|uniref:NAD-dependent epimerase/dehydratase family protein n=1 Tax=Bacillus infantis TaxID=324767 RepID=UPI00215565F9|nr:NAD-dependent epimerase/dehydratase family protein [Bacillus infantis]MCR6609521.1 GDP-mannose 4,6-dehydratase [Bacillus infantis]